MGNYLKPDDWKPVDGYTLEPNALIVTKDNCNSIVVAGPGSGKTELLAQRACFLLQTNTCKYPRRILAISFKRDAAKNLAERVEKRCGKEIGARFESMTYDSFAKSLVDHFRLAIPEAYRPKENYEILLGNTAILETFKIVDLAYANSTNKNALLNSLVSSPLPITSRSKEAIKAQEVWQRLINAGNISQLSFQMISRLAIYIVNSNPRIKDFLQITYSHVFLDEFQDTTQIQYDLVKSCFLNSNSILSAVGDDKQRIMLWAGALYNIFENYSNDFLATRVPLLMNFRSAPRLIKLQEYLVNTLMNKQIHISPSHKWSSEEGIAELWDFTNFEQEAEIIATKVHEWIKSGDIKPEEICIISKQQVDVYTSKTIEKIKQKGIKVRIEDKFQEFLTEIIIQYLINFLYCIFKNNSKDEQFFVYEFAARLEGAIDDKQKLNSENKIHSFIKLKNNEFKKEQKDKTFDLNKFLNSIINYFDHRSLYSYYPNYKNKNYLNSLIENFTKLFFETAKGCKNMVEVIDSFVGKNTIPIMSIHKSKGLEFDTIIFLGLEDGAFWSFQNQQDEDTCAFFVAMSRAKRKLIFTYSDLRLDKWNRPHPQAKGVIKPLYDALSNSTIVQEVDFRENTIT